MRIRAKIQVEMDRVLAKYDAIITPTLNTEAGPITKRFSEWSRGFVASELTAAANLAGLPAITIPSGFGGRGLPTGIELTGRAFNENILLAAAKAYQSATDWHTRRPPME
jgi:aspartyl-tRNA(Asn)/glutamyl-tRNA(Gln) amidotransferase subunit A